MLRVVYNETDIKPGFINIFTFEWTKGKVKKFFGLFFDGGKK